MVNVKKFVSAKYISAKNDSDLKGKKFAIDSVFTETIQEQEKLCIRLAGVDKPLVLNQTNLSILIAEYGEETNEWVNNKIVLTIVKTQFNGGLVDSFQVLPSK